MSERLEKFKALLPENIDAAVIFNPANRMYLTGIDTSDAGTVVITRRKSYFVIDSRYTEITEKLCDKKFEIVLQDKLYEQIDALLKLNGAKTVSVETDYISVLTSNKLSKNDSGINYDFSFNAGKAISTLRSVKDNSEIKKIKSAQKITDDAFEYILGEIKAGMSEKELALKLEFFVRSHGAQAVAFDFILIGGSNTSMPHGVPGEYIIKTGDFVTLDFGASVDGYKSDMTRTIAIGKVSDEQKNVYNTVLEAQKRAIDKIQQGVPCCDVDLAARNYIDAAGYKGLFGHALGHSVGLDIHESPTFSPRCADKLKSGMIITVEPGIYLPGKFGVRIEDMVLINPDGCENLTQSNKSLIIL